MRLLYIRDCPSWRHAYRNLQEALAVMGIEEDLETVQITTRAQSLAEDCGGSPTITRNGVDIFGHPEPLEELACRVYFTADGLRGFPSTKMIIAALSPQGRP